MSSKVFVAEYEGRFDTVVGLSLELVEKLVNLNNLFQSFGERDTGDHNVIVF